MTFERLAEHEDDDHSLLVATPRLGPADYELVFDSGAGLETVILFDAVAIGQSTVTFSRRSLHGGCVETGSIERDLTAWSAVGEWLHNHAAETPSAIETN